ncbi:MAG: F0F1 ATP synthase subunit delta [Gammaproteobacteria bacterium]|nr:F0F1 ATP synthase subunit delta [Gammaproteobacteria bacterium]
MEFSWTTFFLEIINFLVLIWLLKHFFYQPVLGVIEKRRQSIDDTLNQAQKTKSDAELLQHQYDNRLKDWEKEKQRLLEEFHVELNQQREKQLRDLNEELKKDREKSEFIMAQQSEQIKNEMVTQALENGAKFTRQLLNDISGPEQTLNLTQKLLREFAALSEQNMHQLRSTWSSLETPVKVTVAHELPSNLQQQLQNSFSSQLGEREITWEYSTNQDLIAGIRVQIGPWIIRASILDEFEIFRDIIHEQS